MARLYDRRNLDVYIGRLSMSPREEYAEAVDFCRQRDAVRIRVRGYDVILTSWPTMCYLSS
jgi:hypothetical protein